jgi:hypothetical protein
MPSRKDEKRVIPAKYRNHPGELGIIRYTAQYPNSRNDE